MDILSYILSVVYTKKSLIGLGAIKGSNAQIQSIVDNADGTHDITFLWKDTNDVSHTSVLTVSNGETPTIETTAISGGTRVTFTTTNPAQTKTFNVMNGVDGIDGDDGVSITNVDIRDTDQHLIITLSDGSEIDAGEVKGATELSNLEDVAIATLSDGDILQYNATTHKWENKELHIAVNLDDLDNVNIDATSLENGQILKYDAANQKWVNGTIPTIESLNDIDDVNVGSAENGQILKFNGTNWVNRDNKVVDLKDVNISNPQNGQILVYDSVSQTWKNGSPSATETSLDDLSNVSINTATLTDGQVLVYDAQHNVWINKNGGSATIDELGDIEDVNLTNIQDGQIIIWDATHQRWVNSDIATTLAELSDVQLNILSNLDMIRYNATTQKWESFSADTTITENSTNVATTKAIYEADKAINDKIGDINTLATTDKTNVVNAVNELAVKKNIQQLSTMTNAEDYPSEIVEYIGVTTSSYTRGYFYRSTPTVVEGDLVYVWVQTNVQPTEKDYNNLDNLPSVNTVTLQGNKTSADLGLQDTIQYTTMPEANATNLSKIVEYVGATTVDYKTGYFYQCRYDSDNLVYHWVNVDVSDNTDLLNKITTLETNQGDMTTLEIVANSIVDALNKLNAKGLKSINYVDPMLVITYKDDSIYQYDVDAIINTIKTSDLANIVDDTIQNTNVLAYDSAIERYKPYDIISALTQLLTDSKDYTDTKVSEAIVASAYVCDEKPEYDAENDTVIYKQNGVVKTTTQTDARFYYFDASDNPFCTSWINDVEFTFSISDADFDDYVNKNSDVVSTYTEEMLDKTKVPNISALDALMAIVNTKLALKINTADIVDALTSQDATKVLSANQGYLLKQLLDTKQDQLQYTELPVANISRLGLVLQYVGATTQVYAKGAWYRCVYDNDTDTYSWEEVRNYDSAVTQNSNNAPQGGAVYNELQLKQNKILENPITVEGTTTTTVEDALNQLNTDKIGQFQYAVMPTASADLLNTVVQYIGATTSTHNSGSFYKCLYDSENLTYYWSELTSNVELDDTLSPSSTNGIENQAITNTLQTTKATDVKMYDNVASLPSIVNYANGVIVAVGTVAYCVSEKVWKKVSAIDSSTLAITWIDYDPSIPTDDDVEARLEKISALPTASATNVGKIYLLTSNQTGYEKGGVYECQETSTDVYEWVLISTSPLTFNSDDFDVVDDEVSLDASQKIKTFTQAGWNSLSSAEKIALVGQNVIISDDEGTQTFEDIIPSDASASNKLVAESAFNYKSGTVNFNCGADQWTTVNVTFDSPMPDTDYVVTLESGNKAYVHVQNVTTKTTNGFIIIVWNRDELAGDSRGIINWQAYKIPH